MWKRLVAMGLGGLAYIAGGGSTPAATQHRPNPPTQLCIGSKCVTTPVSAGGKIKWHPGHYGGSGTVLHPGDTISRVLPEMNDMLKDDWIVGYKLFVAWSTLDHGPVTFTSSVGGATSGTLTSAPGDGTHWVEFSDGEYRSVTVKGTSASWSGALQSGAGSDAHLYTTAVLDQILNRLKTGYRQQKYLVFTVMPMSFAGGTKRRDDDEIIPLYISNSPEYGPSPDAGAYGWWGSRSKDWHGTYTAAVYRPAVAARYAELGQALGAKYNSDPNVEAIMDQEDSAVQGPAREFPPADPTYSDDAYVTAMQRYLTAWVAAFPNTSVVAENTWLATAQPTQEFEAWMMANRIAPGTADIAGQSYYASHPALNSWGLGAYAGVSVGGSWKGPDMRGTVRPMVDVESGDIGSGTGGRANNTPLDIVNGLNQSVKASHAFWSHYASGTNPPNWAQITAVLRDNPLVNTGYPGNYPQ